MRHVLMGLFRWMFLGLYATGVVCLAMMPRTSLPLRSDCCPFFDKLVHAACFAGFPLVLWWCLPERQRDKWMLMSVMVGFITVGVVLEMMQATWAARRTTSGWDMLANIVGVGLGTGVVAWVAMRDDGD